MVPELEAARLRFRDWRESDVDSFYEFYRDPSQGFLLNGKIHLVYLHTKH